MKRILTFISFAIILGAALASCSKNNTAMSLANSSKVFTIEATMAESDGGESGKTVLQGDGLVYWSPSDSISLFYGEGFQGGSKFISTNDKPVQIANFLGILYAITGGLEVDPDLLHFWGLYPYSRYAYCDGTSITTMLPNKQFSGENTFSNGQFPTAGKSDRLSMAFYNICGGIKFTVTRDDIYSVTIKARGGENLYGTISIVFDEDGKPKINNISKGGDNIIVRPQYGKSFVAGKSYYAVIPPVTLSQGIDVIYKTLTQEGTYSNTGSIEINRSMFKTLTGKDQGLKWENRNDNIVFEDENFKNWCVNNFDKNSDGEINYEEALRPTEMEICTDSITSIEGINYFKNLKTLSIYGSGGIGKAGNSYYYSGSSKGLKEPENDGINVKGQLSNIDLSELNNLDSLSITCNPIVSLNIDKIPQLKKLHLAILALKYLNLSKNFELTSLAFESLPFLSDIDLSKNTALTYLSCISNSIGKIDISNNTALNYFACNNNPLTSIDVSKNTALNTLMCSNNQLTSIDVSKNTALELLGCSNNMLTTLDISANKALLLLSCNGSGLTSLDVSANSLLAYLECYNNLLTSLDVSSNSSLAYLYCQGNSLTSLQFGKNTALGTLNCSKNKLSGLNVCDLSSLTNLTCYDNQLTSLDVSKNTVLSRLDCSPMNDESGNNLLSTLYISEGQSITRVTTSNRSNNYIPKETIIQLSTVTPGESEPAGDDGDI